LTVCTTVTDTEIDTLSCDPDNAFFHQLRIGRAVLWYLLLIYIMMSSVHPTIQVHDRSDFIFGFHCFLLDRLFHPLLLLIIHLIQIHRFFRYYNVPSRHFFDSGGFCVHPSLTSSTGEGSDTVFTIFIVHLLRDVSTSRSSYSI